MTDTAQRERADKRGLNDRSDEYNGQGTIDQYQARQKTTEIEICGEYQAGSLIARISRVSENNYALEVMTRKGDRNWSLDLIPSEAEAKMLIGVFLEGWKMKDDQIKAKR